MKKKASSHEIHKPKTSLRKKKTGLHGYSFKKGSSSLLVRHSGSLQTEESAPLIGKPIAGGKNNFFLVVVGGGVWVNSCEGAKRGERETALAPCLKKNGKALSQKLEIRVRRKGN